MSAVVLDSSALVAVLADSGWAAEWVDSVIEQRSVAAPDLVMFETANVFRRLSLSGALTSLEASLAHADLLILPIQLWPYAAVGPRAWELRGSLTCYDATYVALAELLATPLVTLDTRLARTAGSWCDVQSPGAR